MPKVADKIAALLPFPADYARNLKRMIAALTRLAEDWPNNPSVHGPIYDAISGLEQAVVDLQAADESLRVVLNGEAEAVRRVG